MNQSIWMTEAALRMVKCNPKQLKAAFKGAMVQELCAARDHCRDVGMTIRQAEIQKEIDRREES